MHAHRGADRVYARRRRNAAGRGVRDWATKSRTWIPPCARATWCTPGHAAVLHWSSFPRNSSGSTRSPRSASAFDADETVVEFFRDEPRDACGAGYFITRFPRKFRVPTQFVNAAVEGTEFLVSMRCSAASVAVFEGHVRAAPRARQRRAVLFKGRKLSAGPGEPAAVKLIVQAGGRRSVGALLSAVERTRDGRGAGYRMCSAARPQMGKAAA